MQAETLAGLFGLGGALVGAAVSTGAVVWQQRKITREAERAHLLGLAESAANECIRMSYELVDHFHPETRVHPRASEEDRRQWREELKRKFRVLEEQSLRFYDDQVRRFLVRVNYALMWEIPYHDREHSHAVCEQICRDICEVMGTVLRRQPFPREVWGRYPERS
ncbi:hypothetical protein PS467_09460 [Streptomyces luomodiensis]|uniref:DUF4760 domain-containing protein n=1 Tax=Streptomyces luomodiensis TaxID=3026192 RepID=A0ABY9UUJ1_9ACTN|nr:hypothetical protein [Streptomyces sp. SCA4-21]WNE95550.1 hypothetical protein PS467_09460 [Streptomyces sp. SCA4-21]